MIIGDDSLWKRFRRSRRYSAEEDLYMRLLDNRVWPFEDLGSGIYYLKLRCGSFLGGIVIILVSTLAFGGFFLAAGVYSFPVCVLIIFLCFGFMSIMGKVSTQELIISRAGYLLRLSATRKVIVEQDIYNVYVRLQKKMDSIQNFHYFLIIGGYLLDDIRISRMTANEAVMRTLGRYLARNLGINYFDYHDETVKHCVYHFWGYSTLQWNPEDVDVLFSNETNSSRAEVPSEDNLDKGYGLGVKANHPNQRNDLVKINQRSKSRFLTEAEKNLRAADLRRIARAQRKKSQRNWRESKKAVSVRTIVNTLTHKPTRPKDTF